MIRRLLVAATTALLVAGCGDGGGGGTGGKGGSPGGGGRGGAGGHAGAGQAGGGATGTGGGGPAGGGLGGVPGSGGAAGGMGGAAGTGGTGGSGAGGGSAGISGATGGSAGTPGSGGVAGAAGQAGTPTGGASGGGGMGGTGNGLGGASGAAGAAGGMAGAPPPLELAVCEAFRSRSGGRSGTFSLDLGHASAISLMRVAGDRILSQETTGHWILWDSASRDAVVSGEAATSLDLAGSVLAVTTSTSSAEVRSAADGQLTASLTLPAGPLHVGPGGAYVWSAGTTALRAWTPAGLMVVDVAGDYSQAKVAAVSGELRVALGPAGAGVVERITVGTSARATTPFSASFAAWFDDGQRFLAHTGDTVFVDALDGTQLQVIQFPTGAWMTAGGWGDYFWTVPATGTIYMVGSSTPLSPPSLILDSPADAPGHLVVNLSAAVLLAFTPSSVSRLNPTFPSTPTQIGASPEGHWAFGTAAGLVYDMRSAPPRASLTCGSVFSLDGAPTGAVAVSVATGEMVMAQLGAAGPTSPPYRFRRSDGLAVGNVELTFDGQELATSAAYIDYLSGGFQQLRLLALPAGTTLLSVGAASGSAFSRLRVAGGGGLVSYIGSQAQNGPRNGAFVVTTQSQATVYRTPSIGGDYPEYPLLAPGGQHFAIVGAFSPSTRLYQLDGTLVTAVNGQGLVWMDDNRLLVFESVTTPTAHNELHLYDGNGLSLGTATTASLSMGNVKVAGTDGVYATDDNSIYAVTTGAKAWTGSFPANLGGFNRDQDPRRGSIAGGYVVYPSGHEVIAEPY